MKRLLVAQIVLLVLLVAGLAAFFLTGKKDQPGRASAPPAPAAHAEPPRAAEPPPPRADPAPAPAQHASAPTHEAAPTPAAPPAAEAAPAAPAERAAPPAPVARADEARPTPKPSAAKAAAPKKAPAPERASAAPRKEPRRVPTAAEKAAAVAYATGKPAAKAKAAPARKAPEARVAKALPAPALPAATPPAAEAAAPAAPPLPARRPEHDAPLPPEITGAIAGTLFDGRGKPLASTSVLALSTDGNAFRETTTDDDGAYLLPGLSPGRYAVFAGLGTPLASLVGGHGVDVTSMRVARLPLRESVSDAVVNVHAVDDRGQDTDAQAVLVAGAPGASGSFGPLLGNDVIWLPELGAGRRRLVNVPPGAYTLVLLRGLGGPARAAEGPVVVTGGEQTVHVKLGDDGPQLAARVAAR